MTTCIANNNMDNYNISNLYIYILRDNKIEKQVLSYRAGTLTEEMQAIRSVYSDASEYIINMSNNLYFFYYVNNKFVSGDIEDIIEICSDTFKMYIINNFDEFIQAVDDEY